jgi:hypothetical protein
VLDMLADRRVLFLTAALVLVGSGALAVVFETGLDFQRFARKALGTYESDGKAKKACICKQAGDIFNAAGFLDITHDSTTYFKVRCLVPHPTDPDGAIFSLAICTTTFEVVS